MSEVPPGCGPHRKAASFRLSPMLSIEQTFLPVKTVREKEEAFYLFYSPAKFETNFSGINALSGPPPVPLG